MLRRSLDATWRTVVGGLVFASGLVASRLVFQMAGVSSPRMPTQAPEVIAGWYLLAGSIAVAAGMLLSSRGIRGSLPVRWLVLATFLFVGFGVSTTIEASIYSNTNGVARMTAVLLLPCLLLAGVGAVLFKSSLPQSPPVRTLADALRGLTSAQWSLRLVAAIAAFPFIYFVFGVIVSPVVSPYYDQGVSGLVLPEPGVVVATQFLRGGLHLLAVLPLMFFWGGSRRQLALSLGLAFFVIVTAYDFVLAYQVPAVLVVTHGIEVLTSSFVYSWALVTVLAREGKASRAQGAV
jgi:hypothetical protein